VNTLPYFSLSWLALFLFVLAYVFVIAEESIHIRKSKPMMFAAGLIWLVVGIVANHFESQNVATANLNHYLGDYGQLLLFLIVAMTFVNALEERRVFEALKIWLIEKHFSARALFWITGSLGFFISAVADNLTTALIMGAVVMAVGKGNPKFTALGCINVVIAVNAGGAFCPFGDITTLMVWQKGYVTFNQFFHLFVPALANYLVPAIFMSFALPKFRALPNHEKIQLKPGARTITALFLLTIVTAVLFHQIFHFSPTAGMMFGLAYLQLYSIQLRRTAYKKKISPAQSDEYVFDVFSKIASVEWDTLLFFYGVILSVGGLTTLGFLGALNTTMYQSWTFGLPDMWAAVPANVMVGLLSAVVDNIPVMYGVLSMQPDMSLGQWLLVTLTAGVGGSLLSVGSAAGVALMGQSGKHYTFFSHLKWSWAILLGYVASIAVHLVWNAGLF